MEITTTVAATRALLEATRTAGGTVALVPTMGYLHAGHASLIERAARECDLVLTTLFVNPLQFGAGEDLEDYPRDLTGDTELAARCGAAVLFVPPIIEMYPEPILTTVSVAGITARLEGLYRPDHLAGVATVVTKLFAIAGPCRAYFGEKDWQQLAVIRRMARDLSMPVEVIGCPTVRGHDGLALSSRNAYLTVAERAAAPILYAALVAGVDAIEAGQRDPVAVREVMARSVAGEPLAALDYAEVVDADSLEVVAPLAGSLRLLVAARFGRARLIDNVGVRIG